MFDTLGHYKILERIGAGGMGEVFRARDTRLGRTVAVKVLSAGVARDPARRERFLREARATSALSHPNIAALYEIGEDQGELFLVFEFVPGETLRTAIAGRPLNPRRAIDLAVQLADALADAHAEGIVHRDIKPDNIIVTPKGNAKILDFGLATWTGGGAGRDQAATMMATGAGTTLGTVAYMSPEQALGERVDHRTDIFSLGIVLFEMLTGKQPFSGTTSTALALQIVQAPAPAPSSVNTSLLRELDPIVARALAKSLDQRYESAATLGAELRTVAAILDVRSDAHAAAGVSVTIRPARRSWAGWIVLLLVLAGLGAAAWMGRAGIQRTWRHTLGPAPLPVLAVIPFETDAAQIFFADGLAEDLITRLGQTPGLKVIGRSATRQYRGRLPRDVARELGAAVVLTGSVRPAADSVKVSLELIDPSDDTAVWSGQYTREVKDIFAVQAEVAEQVALVLRLKLQPTASSARAASRAVESRAYDLYVRGRQATAERRTGDAIGLYEQAMAADPGLAEAFAGLAEAIEFDTITTGQPLDPSRQQRLKEAAERAYQLDPDLPQANLAMGLAADSLARTLGYLRHAVELDPSYGEGLHQIGDQVIDFDPNLAVAFYRASLAVDPRLEASHTDTASALATLNQWDAARREVEAVRVDPFPGWRDGFYAIVDADEGRIDGALARVADSPLVERNRGWHFVYARLLKTAGRSDEAFRQASQGFAVAPNLCIGRALMAGLRQERGEAAAARALADPILRAAAADSAGAAAIRCAVHAAAGLSDVQQTAGLLDRIASREEWLRYWALPIGIDRGSFALRGRVYPWTNVMNKPAMMAARQHLDAAYVREREVARAALSGLP